jgi:hypothetical protein
MSILKRVIHFKDVLMELKPSRLIEGEVGAFAATTLPQGTLLGVDDSGAEAEDFILSHEEFAAQTLDIQERIRRYSVMRPGGYLVLKGIDFNNLSVSWYLNHSCDPNVGFSDDGDFVTLRDVAQGEELTYDYGFVESGDFSMECRCGTLSCRKRITGNDHKDPAFRALHASHIYPDLR